MSYPSPKVTVCIGHRRKLGWLREFNPIKTPEASLPKYFLTQPHIFYYINKLIMLIRVN